MNSTKAPAFTASTFVFNETIPLSSTPSYLDSMHVMFSSTAAQFLCLSQGALFSILESWCLHCTPLYLNTTEKFRGCHPSETEECQRPSESLHFWLWGLSMEARGASQALVVQHESLWDLEARSQSNWRGTCVVQVDLELRNEHLMCRQICILILKGTRDPSV